MMQRIFKLAWPTVMEEALYTLVQYADTAQVGAIGARASAAVGLTGTTMWLLHAPMFAAGIGVLSCISISLGAKDEERAQKAAMQSVFLVGIIGVILTAFTLAISPFLPGWLGGDPDIRSDASLYFTIVCAPMLFRTAGTVFGSVLRAAGNTKRPMMVNGLMNAVNILLNFLLILPSRTVTLGGIALPVWGAGWGVKGAAIATAAAVVLGGSLMALSVWAEPSLGLKGQKLRFCPPVMRQCLRVGAPVAAQHIASSFGHVIFTSLIARLGTIPMAAHAIALTTEEAFYIPGYGMQAAAATLAGFSVGERNEKKLRQYTLAIIVMAATLMTVLSILLFLFPTAMMRIFTKDPQVIALGASVLRIVAVSEPFFAVLIILDGVCNGVGDTKAPFLFSLFSIWGMRIAGTFLFVSVLHFGLKAAWVCMVADNMTRFVLMLTRYLRGGWKRGLDLPDSGPTPHAE